MNREEEETIVFNLLLGVDNKDDIQISCGSVDWVIELIELYEKSDALDFDDKDSLLARPASHSCIPPCGWGGYNWLEWDTKWPHGYD